MANATSACRLSVSAFTDTRARATTRKPIDLWVIPEKASSTQKRGFRNRSRNGRLSGAAAAAAVPKIDPEKVRELESLRLAKSNLERQAETTEHPVRKQQIKLAIAEIDKRLAVRE